MIKKGLLHWILSILIFILMLAAIISIDKISYLSDKAKTEKVELLEIASVEPVSQYYWNGESATNIDKYTFLYTDPDTGEICTSEYIYSPHQNLSIGDKTEVVTYDGCPDKLNNDGIKSAKEELPSCIKACIKVFLILFAPIALLVFLFRKALIEDFKRRPLFIVLNALWLVSMCLIAYFYTGKPEVEGEHWHDLGIFFTKIFILGFGYISSLIAWIFNSVYWNLRIKEETVQKPMAGA